MSNYIAKNKSMKSCMSGKSDKSCKPYKCPIFGLNAVYIDYNKKGQCSYFWYDGYLYLKHNYFDVDGFTFGHYEETPLLCYMNVTTLKKLSKIMELFHMEKIITNPEISHSNKVSYQIVDPLLISTNILYSMVFALVLTRDVDEIRKMHSDAWVKFKMLKALNLLPTELSKEICSYLIKFILLCMI